MTRAILLSRQLNPRNILYTVLTARSFDLLLPIMNALSTISLEIV